MLRKEGPMGGFRRILLDSSVVLVFTAGIHGQVPSANAGQAPLFPPPPPTKLEAFQPPVGSVFTIAHEDLGNVMGINIDLREVRDARGKPIRGLIVQVGTERSFVDADELAGLLRGCDALLDVNANPTQFKTFETRFATRGSLELTAATNDDHGVTYSVKVGRFRIAGANMLTATHMRQLRDIFATAAQKLSSLPD
jgi:hypothetical protein